MRAPRRVPPTVKPPKLPSVWSKVVGRTPATSTLGKYGQKAVGKVAVPLHIGTEALSAGEQTISPEARKEAVAKYGTDLGTSGNVGRALKGGFLDPARAMSAYYQGMYQVPGALYTALNPAQYAGKAQRQYWASRKAEFEKSARQRESKKLKSFGDAPREFSPLKVDRSDAEYFYGRPDAVGEADRSKVMERERRNAETQGREPRSWEKMQGSPDRYDREAHLYWTDEDRATYAEMAKNNPDKIRGWFDTDKSGTIDAKERKAIFDPKVGFKAQVKQEVKQEFDDHLRDLWLDAEAAVEAEDAAEKKAQHQWDREMYDFEGEILEEEAQREAEEKRKTLLKQQKRQTRKDATQLKKDRILFAKGLEGDLGYSDTPNSAFQNPETRQRIMEEAYARAEELNVSRPQLRKFLEDKGLLDKGFSESYEDFHKRTTAGGGLRTGKVGGRRTVSAPKREGGGVKTEADIANEEDRRRYAIWLYNERLKDQQKPQQRFVQTQPKSHFPAAPPQ